MKHRTRIRYFLGLVGCFFISGSLSAKLSDRLHHGVDGIVKGAVARACYASTLSLSKEYVSSLKALSCDMQPSISTTCLSVAATISLGYLTLVAAQSSVQSFILACERSTKRVKA